jgi:hypothetical protein
MVLRYLSSGYHQRVNSGKAAAKRRPDGMSVGRPFPKGKSGNEAGRPVGSLSLKSVLRRILDTELKNEPDPLLEGVSRNMTAGEKAMLNLAVKAVADGDLKAIRDIVEMLEGKPFQAVSVEGAISPFGTAKAVNGRSSWSEPDHVLFLGLGVRLRRVFGEAVERHQAAALRLQPAAPVWR